MNYVSLLTNRWFHYALLLALAGGIALDRDHWKSAAKAEKDAIVALQADVRARTLAAQAADLAHAREVEQRNAQIAEDTQHEIDRALASYRASAARYASLHQPAPADPGRSAGAGVPGAPAPAGGPDAAPYLAVVPVADLDACAVSYAVAQGWQNWWTKVSQAAKGD